jgi:hypothetical protein
VLWTQFTDAPLVGLGFAREAGQILAWDDAHNLYVADLAGKRVASTRAPVPLHLVGISDTGHIVVTNKEGGIWWLDNRLQPRAHRNGARQQIGMAISPQGHYLAISSSDCHTRIYDWHGRLVTDLLTHRPLRFMVLLAGQPCLVAAADYGLVGCYELDGEPRWQDSLWSAAGHLSASGEGYAILISCFGHGLQRYGLDGTNEGAYHLGGGVCRAALDYDGRSFAAATLEGEVMLVNAAGHVQWRQSCPHPTKELLLDATGHLLVYGQQTGEITMLELYPSTTPAKTPATPRSDAARPPGVAAKPAAAGATVRTEERARQIRTPSWKQRVFDNQQQAETAVLALIDDPLRVVAFSSRKKLEVYDDDGKRLHASDTLLGVGRVLEADGSLVVAATDRMVTVYDAATNSTSPFPERLVQLSHLRIDSIAGEILVVEEGDRLSRFDGAGERRWIRPLSASVEGLAVGPDRICAVTTSDGHLYVFDGDNRPVGESRVMPAQPLALLRLGTRWITLAGKSQIIRGHEVNGQVEWEAGLPAEAWRLIRLGSSVAAREVGGRSYVLDGSGRLILDSTELPHEALLFSNRAGEPSAVFWRAGNLMVTDLVGRVQWRHVSAELAGPLTAAPCGVACTLGRELAFFPDAQP